MAAVVEIEDSAFDTEVLQSKNYVLVDFWAPWCNPCMQLLPVIEQLAQAMPHLKVMKVNVDRNQEVSIKMNIRAIPALILFKDGKRVDSNTGGMSYTALKNWVEKHIGDG
ncbi:Thioredoxin 1 [Alphaproteobacteria bacterium]